MKNTLLLLFTVLILSCKADKNQSSESQNILFIGNSLTYFHEMPKMVQSLLDETNPNIRITQSAYPGMSLSGHLDDIITSQTENGISTRKKTDNEKTETEKIIKSKKWDKIILQEGTVRLLIPEVREFQVEKAIKRIKSLVNNPDCEFLIFETWASRKEYPKAYCYPGRIIDTSLIAHQKYCSPHIENKEQEISLISKSYDLVADRNGLKKTINGLVFYEANKGNPELELLEDNMHPSKLGAFLNACIFYQILTEKDVTKTHYIADIDSKKANVLKNIAQNNYRLKRIQ